MRNFLKGKIAAFVFDEVQSYPLARQAIKHLVADGRYDYIETESLLSIRENVKDILIPSEERSIQLNPMDFEEFLWANGNENLMDFIRERYEAKCALGPIHDQAMDYFRKYLVIGGMPQAAGRKLYFHSEYDKDDAKNRMEIDFLIAKSKVGRRKNIVPIEVKSGKRYTTSSLDKFANKFRTKVDRPVVLHPKDLKVADGVTYLFLAGESRKNRTPAAAGGAILL